ncbi:MAG: hypothetical protein RSF39_09970 [Romboutsia sp.]
MNNSKEVFAEKIHWLYEHDYERFKIIEALINAVHNDEKIKISKYLNTDTPIVSITAGGYMYKHQCSSDEEANGLIDIVKELNKAIKGA